MARRLSQALRPIKDERGIALLIALMSTLLLTALGLALVMTTMTETMITANYRDGFLIISLPKRDEAETKARNIEISNE